MESTALTEQLLARVTPRFELLVDLGQVVLHVVVVAEEADVLDLLGSKQ